MIRSSTRENRGTSDIRPTVAATAALSTKPAIAPKAAALFTSPYDPIMIGEHDRQESESEEQQAIRVLQAARHQFQGLSDIIDAPRPGSVLMLEREHTAREPIDLLVMAQRSRAVENLERLFAMMIDDENRRVLAYPFSGYSLIRASIEASSVGLWLIQSDVKKTRVLRALQLSYRHAADALHLAETIADVVTIREVKEQTDRILGRLNELKDTVAPLRQSTLGPPPKYTDILKSVSRRVAGPRSPYSINSPLVIWKISSAFLHGSDSLTRALSDMRQTADFDDGIATFEITPSLRMLASSAAICVDQLLFLDQRYTHLATHDHAGRETPPTA